MGKVFRKQWAEKMLAQRDAAISRRKLALKYHDRLVAMLAKPLQSPACKSFVKDLRTIAGMLEAQELPGTADLIRERANEIEALLAEIREASNA